MNTASIAVVLGLSLVLLNAFVFVFLLLPPILRASEQIFISEIGESKVVFDSNVVEWFYSDAFPNEFLACLQGEKRDDAWVVSNVVLAPTLDSSPHDVTGMCFGAFAGTLHSHPDGFCYPSIQDYSFFAWEYLVSGIKLHGIVCGEEEPENIKFFEVAPFAGHKSDRPRYICIFRGEYGDE